MIRSATLGLTLLLALPAVAQDSIDINFAGSEAPTDIGIDNCETRLSESFVLEATPSTDGADPRTPTARIYYYTGDAVCVRTDGLEDCPSAVVQEDGNVCGCVQEQEGTTTLTSTRSIGDLVEQAASIFCVDGGPVTLRFAGELYFPAQDNLSTESILSEDSETITFDRQRPEQPAAAPRVSSADGALRVSIDEVAQAESYEICVAQFSGELEAVVTIGLTKQLVTNEILRAGYSTCASNGVSTSSAYRFTGLTNEINYLVVYAAIDAAGNRGPNSDPATGRPVPQQDFAEYYTSQIGEGRGESGGFCAATPGGSSGDGWWLLGLGALLALRRRRNS